MFKIAGKPFMPMGGQAHNSSAYNADELASAIAGVKALHGNTLIAPLYWEQVEPVEGAFDFTPLETMLSECRRNDLRLILLWFATWKNGEMRYAPEWVKANPSRFHRVLQADHTPMQVLSSFCPENCSADGRAFRAVLSRLAELDGQSGTVIAIQVENEPGILGSDRDYSPLAEAAFQAQVPPELLAYARSKGKGPLWEAWQAQDCPDAGNWTAVFGVHGGEFCTAWSIARFIDTVAAQGRQVYSIPLYVNVWLGYPGWGVPGFYPSGGAVWRAIDVWKCAASHIDLIAPDIYHSNYSDYRAICSQYSRPDNPLFVPESSASPQNARNMLRAIAEFDALGYFIFGVDSILDLQGNIREETAFFTDSFHSVMSILPLLQKFRATGKVLAVVEEPDQVGQTFQFTDFIGMVPFGEGAQLSNAKDHRHYRDPQRLLAKPKYGLIIEATPTEFFLAGNFHLFMTLRRSPQWTNVIRQQIAFTPPDFLSVEEGILDQQGNFTPTRKRNGDEAVFGGFWTSPSSGVTRVRLTPPEK